MSFLLFQVWPGLLWCLGSSSETIRVTIAQTILTVSSYFKILRVAIDDEEIGMDIIKHGEAAYPVAAWREYQYR